MIVEVFGEELYGFMIDYGVILICDVVDYINVIVGLEMLVDL